MGRSGAALRAAKQENTRYTFTRVQLREHDDVVRRQYAERFKTEADRYIDTEWEKRRKEFTSGVSDDDFQTLLSYMLAIPAKVLVERFNWTPCPKGREPGNNRLARFGEAIIDEIDSICSDDKKDIMDYCQAVYDKYGIKFNYAEA